MQQLRVGIIGTGMAFERLHLPAYESLHEQYRITALCDIDLGKANQWAQKLHIPAEHVTDDPVALARRDDVDVIDIMVPIVRNFEVTRQVAEAIAYANKGIITEKPLGTSVEQAEAARHLPTRYGIPILVAENYRYNEEIQIMRDLLAQRRVGDPVFFVQTRVMNVHEEAREDHFAAKNWRHHPDFPGGMLFDAGVHDVAALHTLFGGTEEVHAYGVAQRDDFSPYAVLQGNLRFESGVIGQFTFYTAGTEKQRPAVGLRIFCTEGMIYLEDRDAGVVNVAYNDGRAEQMTYTPQRGYYRELLNFYRHMTEGEPLAVPPEIAFGDTRTMLALLESAQQGHPVRVNLQPVPVG